MFLINWIARFIYGPNYKKYLGEISQNRRR